MTYKKSQPKIADSLSVFVEQIQANEKSTIKLQENFNSFDDKLEKFYQYNPKLNIDELKVINQKNSDELKTINKELLSIVKSNTNNLNAILQNKVDEIKSLKSEKDKGYSKFNFLITLVFVFTIVGTLLQLKMFIDTDSAQKFQLKQQQMETSFKQYLIDNHEEKKYLKWTKRKN